MDTPVNWTSARYTVAVAEKFAPARNRVVRPWSLAPAMIEGGCFFWADTGVAFKTNKAVITAPQIKGNDRRILTTSRKCGEFRLAACILYSDGAAVFSDT
jgi:hypothetical protein